MRPVVTLSLSSLTKTSLRRPEGYLQDILSKATVDGDKVHLASEVYRELVSKYRTAPAGTGPGTELKALLAKFGIHASPTCGCNKMAEKMNEWGPDESLNHIEEIVDVMEETATKRGLPFLRTAARLLVRRAISKSRAMISREAKQ